MSYQWSAGLLMVVMGGAWLQPMRRLPLWATGFVAWLIYVVCLEYVTGAGVLGLGLLTICAWIATTPNIHLDNHVLRGSFTVAALIMALLLASHLWPGFNNPQLLSNVKLTADATPFTARLSFDKAAAGFLLLVFFCAQPKISTQSASLARTARQTIVITIITISVVMSLGVWLGVVRWEWKLLSYTPIFLVVNLMFACLPEEVFFRGILQARLQHYLTHLFPTQTYLAPILSVACSTILFACAHVGASSTMLFLIGLSGLGYGIAYAVTRRLGASVFVHIALNSVHFVFFTYPQLADLI